MPGVVNIGPGAAPASAPQSGPVAQDAPAPAPIATAGLAVAENDGTTITMPTVSAPPVPKIEGIDPLDDGDDADYEILHHRVGRFTQGDKVSAKRFGEGVDFARLLKLEAVSELKAPAAPASETAPASPPGDTKKGK